MRAGLAPCAAAFPKPPVVAPATAGFAMSRADRAAGLMEYVKRQTLRPPPWASQPLRWDGGAMRSYPCVNGGRHSTEEVLALDGSSVNRWVCPLCLMRVSRDGGPMLDDGTPVSWLPVTAR